MVHDVPSEGPPAGRSALQGAGRPSPKWVFVVRALVTVKGTGAAKDELNKM